MRDIRDNKAFITGAGFYEKVNELTFYFPNGGYIDCLSLTYTTNIGKMLKLRHKYKRKETFKVNIRILMIRSSRKR